MEESFFSIVPTDDGTSTALLAEYGEGMHSRSGAYEEALRKHLVPSRVLEHRDRALSVLDVGFGLGYNILALIHEYFLRNSGVRLSVVSLEKERSLLPALEMISFNDKRDDLYDHIRRAYAKGHTEIGEISIEVLFDDARNSLRHLGDSAFHAVFFDPFSPARNPELWSTDVFKELFRIMKDGAMLTTYSSASHVRAAMLDAGLAVGRGPSVGGKREGTIASKGNVIPSLTASEIAAIRSDPRSAPFRDPSLSSGRESIREKRRQAIRAARLWPTGSQATETA